MVQSPNALVTVITGTRAFGDCTMVYPPVLLPFRLSRRSGLTRPFGDNTGARNVLYRTGKFVQMKQMHHCYVKQMHYYHG